MKYLFYLGAFIVFNFNSYSQQLKPISKSSTQKFNVPNDFCGTDEIHKEKMKNDRKYRLRHLKTIENIKQAQINPRYGEEIHQVPVVVHVMHKGEAVGEGSNISDADVRAGIKYLNNFWRKIQGTNGDGYGVDMQIEFALAVQDENGDCTNGIVHVDMSDVSAYVDHGVNRSNSDGLDDYESDEAVNSLKEYSIWDPTKYYNVWLVDEIDDSNCSSGGTAGYATYASSHGQAYDGTVVRICTYLDESKTTWAHEMGHAFNLPHTFDGDDDSGDGIYTCGEDGIFDTPSHIRASSSELNIYWDCDNDDVNDCDPDFNVQMSPGHIGNGTHQDHIHNYMSYSGCRNEFTGGQSVVSKSALMNERASFLPENGNTALIPPAIATVDFLVNESVICRGSSISFTDQSTCIPNTYTNTPLDGITFNWIFDNGVDAPYTSTDQNPMIIYDNLGTYDVTLEVTNYYGTSSLTKSNYIVVTEGVVDGCTSSSLNNNANYGCGVSYISFNTLEHSTSTFIPESSMQDFTCSKNTILNVGTIYDLVVIYKSRSDYSQFLEVWIDWDDNGTFEESNSNGVNERVLEDNIFPGSIATASADVMTPSTAVLGKILRMRVISDLDQAPTVCGQGFAQRADDYGIFVKELVQGCTDIEACNYNENATDTDNSCTYADDNCEICDNGAVLLQDVDGDGVCDTDEVEGCQDAIACNYNLNATENDSSCIYSQMYFDCDGNCINDFDFDGYCDEIDNCIRISNSDQTDSDQDGVGDACDYDDFIGIDELEENSPLLIRMIDVLGREQNEHKKGTLLFYIYDNGTVEKKFNY